MKAFLLRKKAFIDAEKRIYKMCRVNGLSPVQSKLLYKKHNKTAIRKNYNGSISIDYTKLQDDIQKLVLEPDIEYLKELFMPEKLQHSENSINADDVLKATIIGDIIGSGREFTSYDFSAAKTMELLRDTYFYTDDTVLSIATKNAILANPDNPDFRQAYIDAYRKEPDAGYGSGFVCWATNTNMFYKEYMNNTEKPDNTKGYGSFANGSAMRISYIPAYYDDINDVIKHTISSAMTTHNHYDGVKGAVVTAVCIWMALHNYSKEEIYNYCKKHYSYTEEEKKDYLTGSYLFDMNSDLPKYSDLLSRKSLFCNYAVPFVIRCFYDTNSYEECMRKILSYYGDVDTLCAIAGGLCYAYYKEIPFNTEEILKKYNVKGI